MQDTIPALKPKVFQSRSAETGEGADDDIFAVDYICLAEFFFILSTVILTSGHFPFFVF